MKKLYFFFLIPLCLISCSDANLLEEHSEPKTYSYRANSKKSDKIKVGTYQQNLFSPALTGQEFGRLFANLTSAPILETEFMVFDQEYLLRGFDGQVNYYLDLDLAPDNSLFLLNIASDCTGSCAKCRYIGKRNCACDDSVRGICDYSATLNTVIP